MRSIAGLGDFVMERAGFGWSGLSGRRVGEEGAAVIPVPYPIYRTNKSHI